MVQGEADNRHTPKTVKRARPARRVLFAVLTLGLLAVVSALMIAGLNRTGSVFGLFLAPFMPEDDSLKIVAVFSDDDEQNSFIDGIRLAVDHVNATKEKVLGRPVKLELVREDGISVGTELETTVSKTLSLSDRISRLQNLVAVIGHEWSDTAVTASSIYARNDVLFLATHATATSLTNHSFETIFALQPDNATNADLIASYAIKSGYKNFIVLSDKTDYGKEAANFFSEAITKAGAKTVFRGFLSSTRRSIDDLVMFILDNKLFTRNDYDAFFVVSSSLDETAEFIRRARDLGLTVPIFGMEYLFSEVVERKVGSSAMKDVIGVSLYDRDSTASAHAREFSADYLKAYSSLPDLNAALGYDAVTLVRDAVNRAGTLSPDKVSDVMKIARYKTPFLGVTGPLVFDRDGLITDTEIYVVRHDGTAFHTVAGITIPLDRSAGAPNGPKQVEAPGPDVRNGGLSPEMETIAK
ncbi:ABC transporter substrate-binding protein [Breoghania sp.]|uniref:ABC transporter substrate-binding protein n=1 Tax=Breoghania sp. TaxID=2065378 RepID=UPI002AA8DCBC|nr:ABC transporter substrate-binding protein [Breoghania sp.]